MNLAALMVRGLPNRCWQIAATLSVVLCLQGCEEPRLTPVPPGGTILAFGDSLTIGVGADESHSYPSVLSQLSDRRVINAGVSGELTAEGLARLPATLSRTGPVLMILLEGGNDILRNKDPQSTKRNLAAMIELAHDQGVEVILIGVPRKNLFSNVANFYAELAEEHQLVFADDLVASLLRKSSYKSDPIHFNRKGYRAMAERIHELLVENGALP